MGIAFMQHVVREFRSKRGRCCDRDEQLGRSNGNGAIEVLRRDSNGCELHNGNAMVARRTCPWRHNYRADSGYDDLADTGVCVEHAETEVWATAKDEEEPHTKEGKEER